jgi:hypothetical protein
MAAEEEGLADIEILSQVRLLVAEVLLKLL